MAGYFACLQRFYSLFVVALIIWDGFVRDPRLRGSRKFCQRGSNFFSFFFLVDEGREYPNTTKSGHYRPASETPFK